MAVYEFLATGVGENIAAPVSIEGRDVDLSAEFVVEVGGEGGGRLEVEGHGQ